MEDERRRSRRKADMANERLERMGQIEKEQ